MKSTFRQATEGDRERIAEFLTRIFAMPAGNSTTRAENLQWKYWVSHPSAWEGSRSCVLERESGIVAHGAAWPLRILAEGVDVNAVHLIDWAADPKTTGAGISILKQMIRRVEAAIAVGGTEMTRRILPPFGYKPQNAVRYYARPLRPIRQALTHQARNWKAPARFARSLLWSYSPPLTIPSGWSARQIAPKDIPKSVLPKPSAGVAVFERSPELFQYLAACPVAKFALYLIERNGKPQGYFCLFFVPGAARIGDAWAVSGEAWRALYRLAATQALRDRSICEIAGVASFPAAEAGFKDAGYRLRKEEMLVIYHPGGKLPDRLSYNFQLIDSDTAFLHAGVPDYLT